MRAQELALTTIDALDALGWDYLLVGGLAAIQHGITRTTCDVDIVLATSSLAEDAKFILAVQGDALDFAYIQQWCDRHGTRALLDKLRSAISPE